ncbi:rhodanese-related sulfurtransferase [Sphingomonas endolithica]|uniref:oxygen-dependent tRNA uridine(34) hydroxylase TrhO n=1 Tax=Sphingomonas endolithica TaxID=2972485 RepID=UPI0021AE6BD1|nr:rhodanese-related sulfurtransferase [Sphingomonas sp. ZFBP2030]
MIVPAPIRVAALYRFARFPDPAALRVPLLAVCAANHVKGTLLLAREGINGTIAGTADAIDIVLAHIRTLPDCAELEVKDSSAETPPFLRMKVRLKREIVTMGQPDIDPLAGTGHYVKPADWNALIASPDTVVIDTRNDYEVKVGTFAGAIDPATKSFSDFPAWFRAHRGELADKKIAMFCTGGIRCEKSTAFLKAEGLEDVYHLEGGILKYLEQVPASESRWQGECFVFDQRVAVGHGLMAGTHSLCHACRMPVSAEERDSGLYVEGVSCPACHDHRDDTQRAGYAERHRQVLLAQARGDAHVGAVITKT